MRSYGNIWERVVSPENLEAALARVAKGRSGNREVASFVAAAGAELAALRAELLSGAWSPGRYGQFRVTDPKPRTISCAPVRDRVVHHALCGVIAPLLERSFTADCYACRAGMGTHRAAARARELVRRNDWFCKLDIRHYFDSVPHGRLLELLLPLFREAGVRRLIETVVRHPVPGLPPGRGLPIGNLTSQWFANFYLTGLDHFAKERLRAAGYIRYMDDIVLFAGSKAETWRLHDGVCGWVAAERRLEVKGERTRVAPATEGLPFLGLRIFRGGWRFQRARLLRTRRKFRFRERQFLAGEIDGGQLRECAAAADGGVRWYGFRGILRSLGVEEEDGGIWAGGEGAAAGSSRVRRGGSWFHPASSCRSAFRNVFVPSSRLDYVGFRLVSTMPREGQAGSHPPGPAPRGGGDEHARPRAAGSRAAQSGGAAAAPGPFPEGKFEPRRTQGILDLGF
jgi:hypothetical protein